MYIGRIMHSELVTVAPTTTLVEARDLIADKGIDHLLVVDKEGQLVGLLSDRDLKQNWASPATTLSTHELTYLLQKVEVGQIMVKTVITVEPDTTIERAAYIMQTNNISSLPVMESGALVGIITSTDVMAVLLQAIGMGEDSVRLGVFVDDSIGKLADVAMVLKQEQINIQSLFCWPTKDYPGITHLVMRIGGDEGAKAVLALEAAGFRVLTNYEKDLSPYLPSSAG
ncbi:CBS and ACT domain-containing protein [Desulfogranum mediterraneum]|uniref:CBS and ACT domain-containing protein n=1 Tax=Desulfogranum mediterraneum TaxID=160661 RepID=UPI00040A9FE3|nr:CBS and ACT domain-containing protein [Desulfogranum mediterraneum]